VAKSYRPGVSGERGKMAVVSVCFCSGSVMNLDLFRTNKEMVNVSICCQNLISVRAVDIDTQIYVYRDTNKH
jgi:hypothetical protein